MPKLALTRQGAGPPLLLLHGIGLSRASWAPVIPALAQQFDVIAVDLPGFGESKPMPSAVEPTPAALAAAVAELLDELGITAPHVAGNSLGGWVALELAKLRPMASVALLSPAGLWRADTPVYCRVSLRATRWLAEHGTRVLPRVVNYRLGRAVVFGQTIARPSQVSPDDARALIQAMGTCPGFPATAKATTHRRYLAGDRPVGAPVTVAFGSRDRLLLRRQSRHLGELPPDTRVGALPGCGHVPMTDDPSAVVAFITAAAARARSVAQA